MISRIISSIALCLGVVAAPVAAQDMPPAAIPRIAAQAPTAEGLAPEGWRVETVSRADLNKDGLKDAALVIRSTDSDLIIANPDGLGEDQFDSNPRTLIIALAQRGGGYRAAAINNVIIPRIEYATIDDPFDGLSIEKDVLSLTLRYWASAGSWYMSTTTFKFRWQSDAMRLIGYDSIETHRGSGNMTETSVNYLTGRKIVGKGSIEDSDIAGVSEKIGRKPLLKLDDIGNGWEYQP